jgi:hypothetical protein
MNTCPPSLLVSIWYPGTASGLMQVAMSARGLGEIQPPGVKLTPRDEDLLFAPSFLLGYKNLRVNVHS